MSFNRQESALVPPPAMLVMPKGEGGGADDSAPAPPDLERMSSQIETLRREKSEAEVEIGKLKEQVSKYKLKNKSYKDKLAMTKSDSQTDEQLQRHTSGLEETTTELMQVIDNLKSQLTELDETKNKNGQLNKELAALRSRLGTQGGANQGSLKKQGTMKSSSSKNLLKSLNMSFKMAGSNKTVTGLTAEDKAQPSWLKKRQHAGFDLWYVCALSVGLLTMIFQIAFRIGRANDRGGFGSQSDSKGWPFPMYTCLLLLFWFFVVLYCKRHFIRERAVMLSRSVLVWKLLFTSLFAFILQISYPEPGMTTTSIPLAFLLVTGKLCPLIFEACNISRMEFRVVLTAQVVYHIGFILCCYYVFPNVTIHEGYPITSDSGEVTYSGPVTKNGIMASLEWANLFLIFDALIYIMLLDQDYVLMYFVKRSMFKPDIQINHVIEALQSDSKADAIFQSEEVARLARNSLTEMESILSPRRAGAYL